nr:MAG TPA: hypothetical protein [Caudoviricetes sp.]
MSLWKYFILNFIENVFPSFTFSRFCHLTI